MTAAPAFSMVTVYWDTVVIILYKSVFVSFNRYDTDEINQDFSMMLD